MQSGTAHGGTVYYRHLVRWCTPDIQGLGQCYQPDLYTHPGGRTNVLAEPPCRQNHHSATGTCHRACGDGDSQDPGFHPFHGTVVCNQSVIETTIFEWNISTPDIIQQEMSCRHMVHLTAQTWQYAVNQTRTSSVAVAALKMHLLSRKS